MGMLGLVVSILVIARLVDAQSSIHYISQCPGTVQVYHSTLGLIATLATGGTFTQTYWSVSFNVKIGPAGLSLAEFTINSFDSLDFYDLSEIVGYDYAMKLDAPSATSCPSVECLSPTCPDAYLTPDDNYATKSCTTGGTYTLTFCPTGTGSTSGTASTTGTAPTLAPTNPPTGTPPASGYLQSKSNGLYVAVNSNSDLVATASSTSSAVLFRFAPISGGFTIQDQTNSQYVSADNAGAGALIANRPSPSSWETFLFVPYNGYWAIEATDNNKYVALQTSSGNELIATQALGGSIPDVALFSIVTSSGGPPTSSIDVTAGVQVKLYSFSTNLYVTVGSNNLLVASSSTSAGATTFNVGAISGGLTLQNAATNEYASADAAGSDPLVANRPTASTWETFVFIALPNSGYYVIQSYTNSELVSVQSNGDLLANVPYAGTIPGSALFYAVAP